jgi:hypothetical protein
MRLVVLDYKDEFPNLEDFVDRVLSPYYEDIIWEKYSDKTLDDLAREYHELTEESLPVYSSNPDRVIKALNTTELDLETYFITLDKNTFKDLYEEFKEKHSELFLPKILISSQKKTDLLEVSKLFNKSDIKALKYINGSSDPLIIEFEGLETYEYLQTLNSGHLVPATQYDKPLEYKSAGGIPENKKWVLQKFEDNLMDLYDDIKVPTYRCISLSVKSNEDYGIVWTDVKEEKSPNIQSVIDQGLPEDLKCNFYIELENHLGNFYINKIIQGIHPFIKF